jgi:hypothetical protein
MLNNINDTKDLKAKNEEEAIESTGLNGVVSDEGINFEAEEANSVSNSTILGITMID